MAKWQVQEAKAKLSEVIEKARTEGPQTITRHGGDAAMVLSMEEYRRLKARSAPDLIALLLGGPKDDNFLVARDPVGDRNVDLGE